MQSFYMCVGLQNVMSCCVFESLRHSMLLYSYVTRQNILVKITIYILVWFEHYEWMRCTPGEDFEIYVLKSPVTKNHNTWEHTENI